MTSSAADPEVIARAAALLRAGRLVAFPTETVYGLGANALDPSAVARVFEAKGRPDWNPLIVHVPDAESARALVTRWPDAADRLAQRFWPGPLTLVLPKRAVVPDAVTAGLGAVALRVPAHPVALAILRAAAVPVAAPSANRSGELSPTSAEHVRKGLGERVDLIVDGGPTTVGIESAVVDLTGDSPALLRPGRIAMDQIEAVIGPVALGVRVAPGTPRHSPGLADRHYAPRAQLQLIATATDAVRAVERARGEGRRTGAVLRSLAAPPADEVRRLPADPVGYAEGLYAALHALDDAGCDVIVAEMVPNGAEWAGARDRLERAAVR
jgi:L-threonylcarbamoyladenylate synthase